MPLAYMALGSSRRSGLEICTAVYIALKAHDQARMLLPLQNKNNIILTMIFSLTHSLSLSLYLSISLSTYLSNVHVFRTPPRDK